MFGPARSGPRHFDLRRRAIGLAVALLAALLLHGLLFDSLPFPAAATRAEPAAVTPRGLQLRAIVVDPVESPGARRANTLLATTLPTEPLRRLPEPPRPRAPRPSEPKAAPIAPLPGMSSKPEAQAASAVPAEAAWPTTAARADRKGESPRDLQGEQAGPAPIIAPSLALRYVARRATRAGTAVLVWQPGGQSYEATLIVEIAGEPVQAQVSRGRLDVTGLAPARFTDRRRRGALRAVNFQRDVGRISFSGPSIVHELPAGAQDRVSWIVQLAGVIAGAQAAQDRTGEVVIPVAGAGGDLRMWVLRFAGEVEVEVGDTSVNTLKYLREPDEVHDHRVEVWLDPLRHFLPVRLSMRAGPSDPGLDLLLEASPSPPP